jgi:glycerol-3-phosphate O-acyltransferase
MWNIGTFKAKATGSYKAPIIYDSSISATASAVATSNISVQDAKKKAEQMANKIAKQCAEKVVSLILPIQSLLP